jgi:hypothetical protein
LIIRAFSRFPPPPRTQPNPVHHGLKFINSDFLASAAFSHQLLSRSNPEQIWLWFAASRW